MTDPRATPDAPPDRYTEMAHGWLNGVPASVIRFGLAFPWLRDSLAALLRSLAPEKPKRALCLICEKDDAQRNHAICYNCRNRAWWAEAEQLHAEIAGLLERNTAWASEYSEAVQQVNRAHSRAEKAEAQVAALQAQLEEAQDLVQNDYKALWEADAAALEKAEAQLAACQAELDLLRRVSKIE